MRQPPTDARLVTWQPGENSCGAGPESLPTSALGGVEVGSRTPDGEIKAETEKPCQQGTDQASRHTAVLMVSMDT